MRRNTEGVFQTSLPSQVPPWPEHWSVEGVISELEPLVFQRRRERLWSVLEQRLDSVTVVLDAPHDPHNGAAVLRSCDAFGVQDAHVLLRDEPFLVSNAVAQGSERWVDVSVEETAEPLLARLRQQGYALIATHPDGELVPEDLAGLPRIALVFGNERDGIRDDLWAAATSRVRVPMRGFVESLNVSVSAAILLHAATRDRPGDLAHERKRLLYARGLHRSVQRANEVLAARPAH